MIMVFIPIFNGIKLGGFELTGIYGLIDKAFSSPRCALALVFPGFSFLLPAWIQSEIDSGAVMKFPGSCWPMSS